ncbi:hypothetical protein BYT27DRAFT_7106161, partial [Phlegmacium glaucopus]
KEDKVKELEEALEVYHSKYKVQKEAKQTLQKLPGREELMAFMKKFPQCERPSFIEPICHRGVDMTAFSNSVLYLSGRLFWCDQHALALGPQYVFDTSKGRLKKSTFEGQYGKSFDLFYLSQDLIYYGGLYACHDLRFWSPEGYLMPTGWPEWHRPALVQATIEDNKDSDINFPLLKFIEQLYIDQVLKVETMGLQYIGFNTKLYKALRWKFQASLGVLGKRKGSQSESSRLKKIRTS